MGIYRSQNVKIKGLALLGNGPTHTFSDYAIAVAQDFEYDTTVHNCLTYENGTSSGLHVSGCWFAVDPGTGDETPGSENAIAFYRHRDRSTGGTRPELPNGENFVIGVATGSTNPRGEFNVFSSPGLSLSGEGIRVRVSGNQFLDAPPEIGRYDDTQIPSILFGTDGDGVNDADEGNLFVSETGADLQIHYNTGNKLWVYAGNCFGVRRDGTRTSGVGRIEDNFRFDQGTRVRFGSDFNSVSDALDGNNVYDSLLISFAGALNNSAWISMRRNSLVNNVFAL